MLPIFLSTAAFCGYQLFVRGDFAWQVHSLQCITKCEYGAPLVKSYVHEGENSRNYLLDQRNSLNMRKKYNVVVFNQGVSRTSLESCSPMPSRDCLGSAKGRTQPLKQHLKWPNALMRAGAFCLGYNAFIHRAATESRGPRPLYEYLENVRKGAYRFLLSFYLDQNALARECFQAQLGLLVVPTL